MAKMRVEGTHSNNIKTLHWQSYSSRNERF